MIRRLTAASTTCTFAALALMILSKDACAIEDAAQVILPEFDLLEATDVFGSDSGEATPAPKSSESELRFADGTSLHGTFVGLQTENRRILWKHHDADAPLPLPLSSVRTVSLNTKAESKRGDVTVKFTGGDWLTAKVRGVQPGKIQLELPDKSQLTVARDQVEWIYLGTSPAPDCYDGPTSLSGWNSDGSWFFREGALRAGRPSPIGRMFERLPDKVDYVFEIDQQGGLQAFSVTLRANAPGVRASGPSRIQLMFSGTDLRLWAQVGEEMKMEQVDLRRPENEKDDDNGGPPRPHPVKYRVLEDYTGGRLIVFVAGRKVGDWPIAKGEPGKNSGGITFQPMVWNGQRDQSINRVRVMPWDGRVPENGSDFDPRGDRDSVTFGNGEVETGTLTAITDSSVTIETDAGPKHLPRGTGNLIRLRRPENPSDEDPPVARLRMVNTGEFDVSALRLENGSVIAKAGFGDELRLPLASIRAIDFPGGSLSDRLSDVLVFRNGDRLPGTFDGIGEGAELGWKLRGADEGILFRRKNIAGVLLNGKDTAPQSNRVVVARFRNGDLVAGDFSGLTENELQLHNTPVGAIATPRANLQALYFSGGAGLPVLDGPTDSERWTNTEDFRRAAASQSNRALEPLKVTGLSPWHYFDGAYSYQRPESSANASRTNLFLGRILENMPSTVEISFTVTSAQGMPSFSAQLFTEPSSPGYMLQFHSEGIFVNDMVSRPRGGGVFQQQVTYDDKVKRTASRHTIRVLAERDTGHLVLVVDGEVVADIARKAGERPRGLGRGIAIYPQMNLTATFSDLWIGPWDGIVGAPGPANANEPHSLLLANGDNSRGTLASGTAEVLHFESAVGELEVPTDRVTMLRLAELVPETNTAKIRLAPMGTLSVSSIRVDDDELVCKSKVLGDVRVPISGVREIAFAPGGDSTPPPR